MASVVDRQIIVENGASPSFTTSVQAGDIVVVWSANDYYTAANVSAPSATGYTFTNRAAGNKDLGTNNFHCKLYTATAPSTNASLSIACNSHPNDEEFCFILYVLRGYVEAPDVAGVAGSTTSVTPWVDSAVTTTAANDLVICTYYGNGNSTITLPGSLTNSTSNATDGTFTYGRGGDEVATSSGSTGTFSATPGNGSAPWVGCTAAFQVASGGGAAAIPGRPQSYVLRRRAANW